MRLLLLILLFALPAEAADLKVATWNLDWLTARPAGDPALPRDVKPKPPGGLALLRRYADQLNADVVALQEVDGPEIAARIFPPDRYTIHITTDSVVQRVAIAIRRGLPFRPNPDLAALAIGGPERRLRSGADVTLDLPSGPLRLLAVHLKTGCRDARLATAPSEQCATLRRQLSALQGWIAQRRDEGAPFLLLGDFNRWMEPGDGFFAAMQQTSPLLRATAGQNSPCWGGGGFIDHIIAGGAARAWLVPGSLKVLVYRETEFAWKDRLSDHCPVAATLRLPG